MPARPVAAPAPNFGGPMDAHRQVSNALNTLPLPELYEAVEQLKYLATSPGPGSVVALVLCLGRAMPICWPGRFLGGVV